MTTTLADKAWNHLIEGGDQGLRRKALKDLAERGLFTRINGDVHSLDIIETYVKDNPQGFCDDGIERFKEAVGLTEPRTALIAIEVKLPPSWGGCSERVATEDFQVFTADSRVADRLHALLKGADFGDVGEEGRYRFLEAEVTGCVWAD